MQKIKSFILITSIASLTALLVLLFHFYNLNLKFKSNLAILASTKSKLEKQYNQLKNEDQYKRNNKLQSDIQNIEKTYKDSLEAYKKILDLTSQKVKTDKFAQSYAGILKKLSERNYSSALSELTALNKDLDGENSKILAAYKASQTSANLPVNNQPPQSGYSAQVVSNDAGSFTVDIISADLNSTRVIVDTASDSDCSNNCPLLSLGDYVSRSGAYAGINGSFFCPAEYPDCAGKTNSFDTLLMNKNKHYFNSDNNVYSVIPAVIFSGNSVRFVSRSLEWGRDTSVDAVIANHPLYVFNGENVFGGSPEAKLNNKGTRSFVANIGNTVYIGFIFNASSYDAARVLKTMGMQNALGLDQGGSSALWYGGYKLGPGRNIPSALLFVRK